jgi:predicted DNA-binding protein (MmcQ/YjbR family)
VGSVTAMAHPQMFDDADPVLARVRQLALGFPSAAEKISHGRPVFLTKKLFLYYGCSVKVDGEWVQHPQSIVVCTDTDEHAALLSRSGCFVPAYFGGSGWVAMDLTRKTDWAEIAELVDASYRLTAPAKLIAQLR